VRTLALVGTRRNSAAAAEVDASPTGIVLEWLPGFEPLGLPPSFESISRDTYAQGVAFAPAHALRTLTSVCAGLQALHAPGVRLCHGDVYAHNILVGEGGTAKLGDFGAAFPYGGAVGLGLEPAGFERLEVRAFAILVDELAERMAIGAPGISVLGSHAVMSARAAQLQLRKLSARVTRAMPADRPTFAHVCSQLGSIAASFSRGGART
jgi:hypothetical protein